MRLIRMYLSPDINHASARHDIAPGRRTGHIENIERKAA